MGKINVYDKIVMKKKKIWKSKKNYTQIFI